MGMPLVGKSALLLLGLLALDPTGLAAQRAAPEEPNATVRGCRGESVDFTMNRLTGQVTDYPRVLRVAARSPAEIAGLQVGDLIVELDGRDSRELPLRRFAPGDSAVLTLRREGKDREVVLVFGQWVYEQTSAGPVRVCRPVLEMGDGDGAG